MEIDLIPAPIKVKNSRETGAQLEVQAGEVALPKLSAFTDVLASVSAETTPQSQPISVAAAELPLAKDILPDPPPLPDAEPPAAVIAAPSLSKHSETPPEGAAPQETPDKPAVALASSPLGALPAMIPPPTAVGTSPTRADTSAKILPQEISRAPAAKPAPEQLLRAAEAPVYTPATPHQAATPAPALPLAQSTQFALKADDGASLSPPAPRIAPEAAPQSRIPATPNLGLTTTAAVDGPDNTATLDAQTEVPVNIRIERQSVDFQSNIHANARAPSALPVPAQITAQLQQHITKAEKQTIELRLDPPELGRVTIQMATQDQQVTAQISADRVDTIDLMRRHADILLSALERAGFSQANLSFQQGSAQQNRQGFAAFTGLSPDTEPEAAIEISLPHTGLDGRLDIRL